MTSRPRVIYWQNQASPYMVARFNELIARGNIEFEAIFTRPRATDRDWSLCPENWTFRHDFLTDSSPLRNVLHVARILLRRRPDVFISEYDRLDFALGLLSAIPLAARRAVRILPTFAAWSDFSRVRETAKRIVFRTLDGATVSGPQAVALAERYGLPGSRTYRMTQSIDVAHYSSQRDASAEYKAAIRDQYGAHGCVFLYVGRIWSGKGLDTLFDAFARVRGEHDCTLLLVGSGVDEQLYRARAQNIPDIVFAGFREGTELADIYAACDVFVFPTLGDPHGLVVEEAMAAGLPVISSDSAGHIRERIIDGHNGYVVTAADADQLTEALTKVAAAPDSREQMRQNAMADVADMGHHRWAADFEAFTTGILASPARLRFPRLRPGRRTGKAAK